MLSFLTRKIGGRRELLAQSRIKDHVDLVGHSVPLELLRLLTHRLMESRYLYLNNNLLTVPAILINLVATVDYRLKRLSTSNITVDLTPRKRILTLRKMVFANIHQKMLQSVSLMLSISPWVLRMS